MTRGRPKAGTTPAGSSARTVRLPDAEWEALDELAATRGTTPHAAMREAIVQWLARAGATQLDAPPRELLGERQLVADVLERGGGGWTLVWLPSFFSSASNDLLRDRAPAGHRWCRLANSALSSTKGSAACPTVATLLRDQAGIDPRFVDL